MNGGGKYKLKYLRSINSDNTTKEESHYLNSDLDFSICDEKALSKVDNFTPYFGAYELRKRPIKSKKTNDGNEQKETAVFKHIDFCKMASILRCMIKGYSKIGLSIVDLERITVWGVLQSCTQIWFLKCKAEIVKDATSVNCYSIIYNISYSNELDVIKDNEKACKLFCKMMDDAAQLIDILQNFTPTNQYYIRNTDQGKHTISTFSFELEQDLLKWFFNCYAEKFSGIEKCTTSDGVLNSLMKTKIDLYFESLRWSFVEEKLLKVGDVPSYLFKIYQSSIYFYKSANRFVRNVEVCDSGKPIFVFFRIEGEKFLVLQYRAFGQLLNIQLDESLHSADKGNSSNNEHDKSPKEGFNNNDTNDTSDGDDAYFESMDVSNLSNAQTQLEAAHRMYLNKIKPDYRIFCNYSICSRNIYGNIFRGQNATANFLKYAHTSTSSEAISVMQKLANQELSHKNINRIEFYTLVKKYYKSIRNDHGLISITECEGLEHLDVAIREMNIASVSCLLDWILDCVIFDSLDGLEYLHKNGIIHGDLSFGNIMFKRSTDTILCKQNKTNYYYAVICDLNECLLMEEKAKIQSRKFGFGKQDYLMSVDCVASVATDCFAWMLCVCKIIYFTLFRKRDSSTFKTNHEDLKVIFELENWNRLYKNDVTVKLSQTLNEWKRIFERVICKKSKMTCEMLKEMFKNSNKPVVEATPLVSDANKENICPVYGSENFQLKTNFAKESKNPLASLNSSTEIK